MERDALEQERKKYKNAYEVEYQMLGTYTGVGFADDEETLRKDLQEELGGRPGFNIIRVELMGSQEELDLVFQDSPTNAVN